MGDRCIDINECMEQQGLCPRPGTCKNTHGGFQCVCPRGYILDETGTFCEDRNECEEDDSRCETSECRNTAGSYKYYIYFLNFKMLVDMQSNLF